MEFLRPLIISEPTYALEGEEQPNERVLNSLYFVDDRFRNSYGRNNSIFEYWSYALFVGL